MRDWQSSEAQPSRYWCTSVNTPSALANTCTPPRGPTRDARCLRARAGRKSNTVATRETADEAEVSGMAAEPSQGLREGQMASAPRGSRKPPRDGKARRANARDHVGG